MESTTENKKRAYTTITISVKLSKRIRLLALQSEMKTQRLLEMLVTDFENKKDSVLFDEADIDMEELGLKKGQK